MMLRSGAVTIALVRDHQVRVRYVSMVWVIKLYLLVAAIAVIACAVPVGGAMLTAGVMVVAVRRRSSVTMCCPRSRL